MHKLEVTEAELKYRANIHDELRAQRQRELSCTSCGNILSHKSQEIFSHPIFEILQCRKCNKSARAFLKSKDSTGCQICTAVSKSSYKCSRRNCCCTVCQACLRRNAVNSLAEAGSAQWKCLACNSKPLWKLRGVCAAVMSFTPKRTKKKQVSGNSDTDDEKTNFKNISYVKNRRISDLNQLKKRLDEICDEESSSESGEPSRPLHDVKNKTTYREQLNVHKKAEQYSGYGNILETGTSSDDSSVLEIKSIGHKKPSKFQNRRESPEKIKNKSISQTDSRSWRKESRRGVPTSPRKMVNSVTYATSDDSDFEGSKKVMTTKRNSKGEPSGKRRKISEATANGYKSGKSKEEMNRKAISLETSEQDEEEDENSMELRNPVKNVRRTDRQSSSRKATRGDTKSRKPSNEKEKVDQKSNKSQHHRRLMKNDSVPSDSSSGREFHKSKLFPSSYVALKRIDQLEKDYTKTPEASPGTPEDTLTTDQMFGLQNSVKDFFEGLKKAAKQLINDIEVVERQYRVKNSMRPTDVDDFILKTKNVVTNYKKRIDTGENKIEDYYDTWCKKVNLKNVLRAKKTNKSKEVERPSSPREERPKKSLRSKNDSSDESSPAREKSRSSSPATPTQSTNVAVISDCNSEEIFSGDSIRNSSKKRNSSSSTEGSDGAISREPSVEKASIIADVSSDKNLQSSTPKKVSKKSLNKSSSSTDLSDRSIDMDDKKKASELNENPKMLNSSRASARSVNLSDSDMFEDNDDATDKRETEGKKGNESIGGTSDIEENSTTPVKTSIPEKCQTKIDSPRSSTDSQHAAKSTNSSKSRKIPQDSNAVTEEGEKISTKSHDQDSEKNAEDDEHSDNESISSRETLLVDPNVPLENGSKSLAVNDDIEALDSTPRIGEDTEDFLERTRSPADIAGVETPVSRDDNNDKTLENADLKSPNENSTAKTAPERQSEKKKSRSSSPTDEAPKKRSSEKEMKEKCIEENNEKEKSNSSRVTNSRKRSSEDSDENDMMEIDKPLKSRSNSSRRSTSSTPSEGDDLEARNKLLLSSNSEESSGAEDSFVLRHSSNVENEDDPQTLPKSDSDVSKTIDKNKSDVQSGTTEKKQPLKTKRTKFRIENHPHLMKDKRLRQECVVSLKRLKQRVLDRYSKALEKSRDYVDSKKLKRLVDLDNLDKNKAVSKSSNSEDDDTSHKDLKNKKKGKAAKEREETLLDHLEKVKNGKDLDQSIEYGTDGSDTEQDNKNKPGDRSEDNNLFAEAEKMAKKRLLESSESEKEEPSVGESSDKQDEGKKTTKKTKGAAQKDKSDKLSDDDEKREDKAEKSRWRKNKLLTLRISDSDSNDEKRKSKLLEEKSASKAKKGGSESDDSEEERSPKKKRIRRRVLHSDSDGEPSPPSASESSNESDEDPKKKKKSGSDDEAKKKRKRKKKADSDSSSSDSLEEKRPKTRRKRIKTADSDSDSDLENSQGSPSKAGRKNIRKLIRDKQVADVTKQAGKDEEERLQRIAERQKLYNQMYENRLASETKVDKLVLDFNEETKEVLVSVDEGLVKKLKPHQAQGIKFMWDACFESLERIKTTKGSGCILAHCMGLGKSFQVVALSHTLLQHEETGIKTIMVVCPLSTVLNWANEFKIWLENLPDGDDIEVYELTKLKQNSERKFQLQRWQKTGGVMIIGYEMFRNLSNTGKKVRKNMQDAFLHCLVDPGPDLIVCDEGHLLKNEDTALSKAMRRVKTLRRIVLTGTPLQNNLIEYHCMVQFVKPNLLGTKKEFTNRFENPITNGQFDDSTEYDVRLMKKRAHVLHKMLEGSVQRLDYSVLTPFLPPKQEYVIFVKLTEVQIKMYRHYLENYARRVGGVGGSLFADFQALQRIWTHPLVVRLSQRQKNLANEKKRLDSDSEGSLRDFINDGSDSDTSSSGSDIQSVGSSDEEVDNKRKRGTRANPVKEEEPEATNLEKNEEPNSDEWWEQFINEGDCEDMRVSCKLLILFAILKQSHAIGDKVLVFSQSLYSLTLIEEFLRMIDDATQAGHDDSENLDKHSGSWSLGLDYFRLDGQTSADNRRRWCDIFNRPSNTRARLFLISTRAGGLGINLTAANRVIIFDASWNPSHDVQSIFRIYRFGQKKPCYVYRLLAAGTMEEKIYNRQVTKLSLSCRVVDEQQIERHYSNNALAELYELEVSEDEKTLNLPKDRLLADIFLQYKHCVFNYHEHDSLLENQAGEELDEEERQQAWLEYEEEKKGRRILPPTPFVNYQNELLMQQTNLILAQQNAALTSPAMMLDYENIKKMMSKDYPGVSEAQQKAMATRIVYEMYNYVERQAVANQPPRVNQIPLASQLQLANQMPLAMINMGTGALHFDNRQAPQPAPVTAHPTPEMIRMYQESLNQPNGQMNFTKNKNITAGDSSAHAQNSPVALMPQLPSQSTTLPAAVDDDIIEIPASPEKILGTPPVPGGSRKSQEE